MSAFGGKADVNHCVGECPLLAISGHWWANENGGSGEPPLHGKSRRGGELRARLSPPPAHQAQPGEGREEQRQRGGEGDGGHGDIVLKIVELEDET